LRTRLILALGLCAAVALLCAEFGARHPADATARMEQLAGQIDRARVLHPDAVRQLEQLMDMPQYDCARVACNADLQARNQAVRARLKRSIASKIRSGKMVAAGHAYD
jgi:hypothetical protein